MAVTGICDMLPAGNSGCRQLKDGASLPTDTKESVFLTTVLRMKVKMSQQDMEEAVHMQLEGKLAEVVVAMDLQLYESYVISRDGGR
jgi:hypothetical protein